MGKEILLRRDGTLLAVRLSDLAEMCLCESVLINQNACKRGGRKITRGNLGCMGFYSTIAS